MPRGPVQNTARHCDVQAGSLGTRLQRHLLELRATQDCGPETYSQAFRSRKFVLLLCFKRTKKLRQTGKEKVIHLTRASGAPMTVALKWPVCLGGATGHRKGLLTAGPAAPLLAEQFIAGQGLQPRPKTPCSSAGLSAHGAVHRGAGMDGKSLLSVPPRISSHTGTSLSRGPGP